MTDRDGRELFVNVPLAEPFWPSWIPGYPQTQVAQTFARFITSDGLVGETPLWGRFWEHPVASPEQRATLIRARDALRERLVGLLSVQEGDALVAQLQKLKTQLQADALRDALRRAERPNRVQLAALT